MFGLVLCRAAGAQVSYTPGQVRTAYGVGGLVQTGVGTTIAIVDSNNDSTALSDANAFSNTYGLTKFNGTAGPTLTVINQTGGTTAPTTAATGSSLAETSLDIQWAHAIAPGANILLVQSNSMGQADLSAAIRTAKAATGVSTVSMSFGVAGEYSDQVGNTGYDNNSYINDTTFAQASGHPGVAFLAATGDGGKQNYPATSPLVLAIGGTTLKLNGNNTRASETVWNNTADGSGGTGSTGAGVSLYEAKPTYQKAVTSVKKSDGTTATVTSRVIPDVVWDGDPYTGYNVYYNGGINPYIGGTSISCPQWAGLIALADQTRLANGLNTLSSTDALNALYALYGTASYSQAFYDVTSGTSNGYAATTGYDAASGLGAPNAAFLVPYLATYAAPEPTSLALLVFAGLPVLGGRRRRQSSAGAGG